MDLSKIILIDTGAVESNDNDMRSQFERAVVTVMNSTGYTFGLPPVAWRVGQALEGLFVSGTIEGPDAVRVCLQWAAALSMKEYDTTRDDGGREWVSHQGPWRIELAGVPYGPYFMEPIDR